ncbi:MAG: type III secretion system outer membrane ring subunit SctC [Desulfovibrionales bacterium]|nr:type III secretion system outer membrane ring subunit SctC [Desulfovibrionales bacterium]
MTFRFLRTCSVLIVLGLLCISVNARVQDVSWADKPFYYNAKNESLAIVLRDFCQQQNVASVISDKITANVTGDFMFDDPARFLMTVARNNELDWYFDGTIVYFYSLEEIQSAMIELRWLTPAELEKTLRSMGLYDERYRWRSVRSDKLVYLNGPPRYVELVKNVVQKLEKNAADERIMKVFKLKHAWADDIKLEFMDESITVPGVATLLRNLTSKRTKEAAPKVEVTNQGLGHLQEKQKPDETIDNSVTSPRTDDDANRILADPRLNAVVVWDVRERIEEYRQAIEQLDKPVSVIEIRAAIIDVSVNRLNEIGFSWSGKWNITGDTPGQGSAGVGGINVGTGDSAVDFFSNEGRGLNFSTIYTNGIDQLIARIHALESEGDANILSRPSVLTLDNVQAMLERTSTFYITVEGERVADFYDVTYGTVMKVTPHVLEKSKDGEDTQVKLVVSIEDGASDDTQNTVSAGTQIPTITRSTVNTQAIIGEGQALVIGGHYFETRTLNDEGVPGLRKIPFLGNLFNTSRTEVMRVERLFVISPRVVDLQEVARQQQAFKPEVFSRSTITPENPFPPEDWKDPTVKPTRSGCSRRRVRAVPSSSRTVSMDMNALMTPAGGVSS